MNMTSSFAPNVGKAMRFAILAAIASAAPAVCAASLVPITPEVDHSKKATCGIKWTIRKAQEQSIKYFMVFRGTTPDFYEADCIAEVDKGTTRLTDWGADQYQTYYYWVIPFDYEDNSPADSLDMSRYACKNNRYWGSSDVYLTTAAKTIAIGSALPLYFKVNMGTSGDPLYDHVKPDSVRITRMTDLAGNDANDIAVVVGNRGYDYAMHEGEVEGNTYLKANGAFGYLVPNKPGVLYLRAYYKSATTASPLRVEIKRPTFNLYAPEGEIDIIDNMYRDLYLKCNGKFVAPTDVECTVRGVYGPSVRLHLVSDVTTEYDDEGKVKKEGVPLYDNAFGFVEMMRSDETCMYDISFNGMLVKEYVVTPTWDNSRDLKFFFMDINGNAVSSCYPNQTYHFGIMYGTKTIPHTIHKYGYYWQTYDWGDWGIVGWNGPSARLFTLENSSFGALGGFLAEEAGWLEITVWVFDRRLTNSAIHVINK